MVQRLQLDTNDQISLKVHACQLLYSLYLVQLAGPLLYKFDEAPGDAPSNP